jgi:hypothetical protein
MKQKELKWISGIIYLIRPAAFHSRGDNPSSVTHYKQIKILLCWGGLIAQKSYQATK